MSVTTLLLPTSQKGRRWTGGVFGLLVGLAVVCHGCHRGDHDDELSLTNNKPHVESCQDQAEPSLNREQR